MGKNWQKKYGSNIENAHVELIDGQLVLVENTDRQLKRTDHRQYDEIMAKAAAKAEEAKARPAAELVCEIPGPCRIYLFQGSRLFIARAGQTPVELIPGAVQALKALS
jgi:hypothetical protein